MARVFDTFTRDLRFTRRMFAARPGWTIAAVLCLAIATGANTAAFTIVNGLLLRPLPFPEPNRLVMVALREKTGPRPFALSEYRDMAGQSSGVQLLARTFFPLSLAGADGARMAQAELVSGNYFETLRVAPYLGQFFDASADRARATPLTVLSHHLWRQRFQADPAVIGRSVRVNGRSVLIAGVAPPEFVGAMQLVAADLWLPASIYPELARSGDVETIPMFGVMGRLADGVSANDAAAQLTSVAARLRPAPVTDAPLGVVITAAAGFGVPVAVRGTILMLSTFIYIMMALLMAVACANVAALVLARGVGRTREIAIRLSVGASRMHIARQLLFESAALALAGCSVGSLLALWLTQVLVGSLTTPFQYVTYAIDVHAGMRVFAYSALATAVATLLCGIAPIRHAVRVDVLAALTEAAARGRSRASSRTLNAMVVIQFAVSTALLVSAGTLVRTYADAASARTGFNTSGVIATTLDLNQTGMDQAAGIRFFQRVVERLSALPSVTGVGLTSQPPLAAGTTVSVLPDTGSSGTASGDPVRAAAIVASHGYFESLGLKVRQGRSFSDNDPSRPRIALVDEAMAQRLWPDASPVGRTFRIARPDGEPITVIGVVANAGKGSETRPWQPAFYEPFPHHYQANMTIVMRVHGDAESSLSTIRQSIQELNPDLSIVDLRTFDDALRQANSQRRIPAAALTAVALLGLLLSAVGLYGVIAYSVREQARELGIRLALGARPAEVRRLIFRRGLRIVGLGLALGAVATVTVAQLVRRAVFALGSVDAGTLTIVAVVLVGTALAALYSPARWASRLEPADILRTE